jgi:hypothetical protein
MQASGLPAANIDRAAEKVGATSTRQGSFLSASRAPSTRPKSADTTNITLFTAVPAVEAAPMGTPELRYVTFGPNPNCGHCIPKRLYCQLMF